MKEEPSRLEALDAVLRSERVSERIRSIAVRVREQLGVQRRGSDFS